MIRRAVLLSVLVLVASSAHASWYPLYEPSYIRLRPGETRTIDAFAAWLSGISYFPFQPISFAADDPTVATVEGNLPNTERHPLTITARAPGVTRIRVVEAGSGAPGPTAAVIVVAEREFAISVVADGATATPNHRVTLTALTDEPDATFTWYVGPRGGWYTYQVGTGPTFTFTPLIAVDYEYWVLATSPHGAGVQDVRVPVRWSPVQRRRSARTGG